MLYFAYTARIDPARMANAAPGATFAFIAHLSGWGIDFPLDGSGWGGALPTACPEEASTVWGAVYSVPASEAEGIDAAEQGEGRMRTTLEAIDRSGRRHSVVTHVAERNGRPTQDPSTEYVMIMMRGSRHWGLPAGWIANLGEHIERGF